MKLRGRLATKRRPAGEVLLVVEPPRAIAIGLVFLHVIAVVIMTVDVPLLGVRETLLRMAMYGIACGAVYAINDVALVATSQSLMIRNPIFVRVVGWSDLEALSIRQGLLVKARPWPMRFSVSVASNIVRFRSSKPRLVIEQLEQIKRTSVAFAAVTTSRKVKLSGLPLIIGIPASYVAVTYLYALVTGHL
jgi:hypothetical protein